MNESIRDFLQGRLWLKELLPFPEEEVAEGLERGWIGVLPGIHRQNRRFLPDRLRCNRCLSTESASFASFDCARCGKVCQYCRHCIRMGRVASCDELVYWAGPERPSDPPPGLSWAGRLTPAQQKASEEILESLRLGRPHLLHAVCGAGKTEILFRPVHSLLEEGKRVCIATPRTDVVLELLPRFRAAFGDATVHGLYGGSGPGEGFAPLVIATTHQLYRFRHAFDVIFVDEADAFPYSFDRTLRDAVKKAAKPGGSAVFVTATPSAVMLAETEGGGRSVIRRRFHGHPLPVPRFEALWNYRKQIAAGRLPKRLSEWIAERLSSGDPFLVFFPSVRLMEQSLPLFNELDGRIGAVHASSRERRELVRALRDGKVPGLLTTTILERGITIPGLQAAVLGAEDSVFSRSAIIQIGGRVGRSADRPDGDVVLFHHGITPEMDDAVREIRKLNREEEVPDGLPAVR
ncbi:DEAD/DEAH box helicase [Bhargavaea cecembensis]|uniref:DEAD/DEAH box helicase n=1 Tax=Bhargavaea cecembensis TaxID=394098 RepID=UPI000A49EEF4|nr:helicase-related protein [Bhargavaea cecembensis]